MPLSRRGWSRVLRGSFAGLAGLVGLVVGGRGSVCVRLVLLVSVMALRVGPAVYLAHAWAGGQGERAGSGPYGTAGGRPH